MTTNTDDLATWREIERRTEDGSLYRIDFEDQTSHLIAQWYVEWGQEALRRTRAATASIMRLGR